MQGASKTDWTRAAELFRTALEIDPSTGQVTNTTIPDGYIKPEYREGWDW